VAVATAAYAAFSPSTAHAQQVAQPQAQAPQQVPIPGGDTVVLKNGSRLTGTLVGMASDKVTLQLPTGQLALIPTPEIDHIERKTMTAGSTPPQAAPAAAPVPSVYVHIDSPQRVSVDRTTRGHAEHACDSPCDKWLPLDGDYRISGEGMPQSSNFTLRGNSGDRVTVHVEPGSKGPAAAGWVLFGVGTAGVVVGLTLLLTGWILDTADKAGNTDSRINGDLKSGGAASAIGGLVLVVGGIVLVSMNKRTTTDQDVTHATAAKADDRWLRLPVWKDVGSAAPARSDAPAPLTMPIFSASF
jgi:hypothetical protein